MSAGKATLWDTATSKKLQTFAEGAMDLALSDDGKIVVTHSQPARAGADWRMTRVAERYGRHRTPSKNIFNP